jgi:lipid II isoglutaminyl synthase (glutamine-hydrolysing)
MRLFLAILVGKLIHFLTRTFKIGGGSAAPGLYALKVDPNLVSKLSSKIPKNIIITGTNGKTTTARIISYLAGEAGLKVIRNITGSNLERGIASALVTHYQIPNTKYDLGVWELDEAAFNKVVPKLKPDIVVFLNVFRDQLDRYGEIDSVINRWTQTLKDFSDKTTILVNGDDANTLKLKQGFKGMVKTFGVEDFKIVGESLEKEKDSQRLDFEAKSVKQDGLNGSSFQFSNLNSQISISIPIPGIYHVYDAVAALAACHLSDIPIHRYTETLTHFLPAFGRVEKLPFGIIFLIKNPAGATQVLETIAPQIKPEDRLLVALNDNFADGKDVSWIWDTEFERLATSLRTHRAKQSSLDSNQTSSPQSDVIISGTRAYDMALRLKYSGIDTSRLQVISDLKKALGEARKGLKGQLFILPTYTALLSLQQLLAQQGVKRHYWRE